MAVLAYRSPCKRENLQLLTSMHARGGSKIRHAERTRAQRMCAREQLNAHARDRATTVVDTHCGQVTSKQLDLGRRLL